MSVEKFEKHLRRHIEDMFGEQWPLVAYVVYARVTDPETMTADQPVWIIPDGQRSFVTSGLLREASSEHEADNLPITSYAEWEADDDE